MKPFTLRVDLRVAFLYTLFGGFWILLSDRLLAALVTDISLLTTMQTYKGWTYVMISALLIYFLLRREMALRKIAEDKLQEREEGYRLLFETSIDAFLLTAPDGSVHAVNPAACRMFGWTEEEIKQIGRSGVVDTSDPRLSTALEERARKGYFRGELTFIRKDGKSFLGEISTAIFTDKNGNDKTSMVIRDITERVQAQKKQRESQLRLTGIIDSAMDAIITLDADQNIILFNPAAEKMFLCSADEAIGQPLDRFIPKNSREIHREHIRYFGQTSQTKRSMGILGPLTCLRNDGEEFPAEITISQTEMSGQRIYTAILRDITTRVQTGKALRDSEQRFRTLIEQSPFGIQIFDPDGTLRQVNRAWEELWQARGEDTIGQFNALGDPQIREAGLLPIIERAFAGEAVVLPDIQFDPGESGMPGRERWIRTHGYPVKDQNSRVLQVVVVNQDITDYKHAEQALLESEKKYRLLFENMMNGFALHEIVLNDEGKPVDYIFLEVNEAFEQLTGLERENILGKRVTDAIPGIEHDPADWIGQYGEVTLTGNEVRFEQRTTSLGKWYSVLAFCPRDGQFATIFEDITERKQAEIELHRRVDELSALYQTTLDIINVQDLPDLLNTIVMRAVDLLDGTGGGLYLCDAEQKQARCVVSYKTLVDYTGTVLTYGEGAAGTVAATGEPLVIEDYQTWEGRAEIFEGAHPFSAVISVPMFWRGGVTGVIHVLHDTQKNNFTDEDLKLLTSFANQAAVVVENARLLEETQRRLDLLSALRRIDQVITSSLDLQVTLNILLGQILQLMEVDAAAVLLYRPELQNLEFVAGQGFRTRTLQSTNLHLGTGFAGLAAKERRIIQVLDLEELQTGFLRSPEFRNEDFVAYIGVPLIAKGNTIGVLEIYNRQQFVPDEEWMGFLETLAGQAAIAIDNINLFNNLEKSNLGLIQAYDATIEGWARALELRDMETEGHSRRVVDMTIELARQLGIEEKQLIHVRQGALLHDIGKMGVPDSILQKTDSLTEDEWAVIYQHPVYANEWLSPISYLKPALDIPYCHHERWDGNGYPRGLKGEQIPLAARIFAVIDVWDALRSDRAYRAKWSKEKTRTYIMEQSGKHFDPEVVKAFLIMIENE